MSRRRMAKSLSRSGRICLGVAALLLSSLAQAVPPVLSELEVADVTPSSVTLIWEVDEVSAEHAVRVFTDAAATTEITSDFEITQYPLVGGDPAAVDELADLAARGALITATAGKGLARLTVDGLTPSTTYYFRARSVLDGDAAELPAATTVAVTTESLNSFITRSQQLRVRFQAPDPTGWVVLASSSDVAYPVSAIVGDGGPPNEAVLNLAQLFNLLGSNYEPVGETTITLRVREGEGIVRTPSFDVTFVDGFAVGIAYQLDVPDPDAQLQMVQPAVLTYTEGETVVLAWVDDLPPASEIALFFDADDSGADGTAIVSGLDADADGAADSYAWDTSAVPDGVYWVYAQGGDGGPVTTSYAPAPLAIDRAGIDGDADSMADLWEQLYFGDTARSGGADDDGDGRIDSAEFADRTAPFTPDFRLRGQTGLNLVSLPIQPEPALSSDALIASLGGIAESIERIDVPTQAVSRTVWDGAGASGDVFPLNAKEGYMLRLAEPIDAVYVGIVPAAQANLGEGVNLVGFSALPAGYTAFDLLVALGGETVVASVAQLDTTTGRFRSATFAAGSPIGFDFPVRQGASYLLNLRQPVVGFSP